MVAAIPFDLLIFRSEDEVLRGGGEGEVRRRKTAEWEGRWLHNRFSTLEKEILCFWNLQHTSSRFCCSAPLNRPPPWLACWKQLGCCDWFVSPGSWTVTQSMVLLSSSSSCVPLLWLPTGWPVSGKWLYNFSGLGRQTVLNKIKWLRSGARFPTWRFYWKTFQYGVIWLLIITI